ncbi:MAG: DUF389 domain-containing protein [Nitriliruptoraceae bacterium]|nr:DUF389 domain-containing protein [Nitriliruptoraceae bacterium]
MRSIGLTVPERFTDSMLGDLRACSPLAIRLQRGGSLQPPGDVIELEIADDTLGEVMRIADRYGLGETEGVTMVTSTPSSIINADYETLTRESQATTWEELELSIGGDSTMRADRVLVMAIAGFIAGLGIVTGTVHAVIGAMVIAPGFQPFSRFVLGLVTGSSAWRGGLNDVLRAYGALLVGATLAGLMSAWLGVSGIDAGDDTYLAAADLVAFWTEPTWHGIAISAVAAVCGGLLIAIDRTVLTAGVMVALALVPTAALVPMSLIAGEPGLALAAAGRFGIEVALVLAGSAAVFLTKRASDQRWPVD